MEQENTTFFFLLPDNAQQVI